MQKWIVRLSIAEQNFLKRGFAAVVHFAPLSYTERIREAITMKEELAEVIDAVFGEFQASTMFLELRPKSLETTAVHAADVDADWYDVAVEESHSEMQTDLDEKHQPDEAPMELALHHFKNVNRSKGSMVSENATIHGNIQFQNPDVEIHAVVNGNIDMPGDSVLLIGKRAMITGDICCNMVSIAGVVIGNIYGDSIQIQQTGSIQGNVIYASAIGIATGAEVCGRIQKIDQTIKRTS